MNRVVAEALRRAGFSAVFEWLPIGRMLMSLENDVLDVYVTPSNTAGQQHPHVDFLAARGVFFFMKSRWTPRNIRKLEDMKGLRVATVLNSPLTPLFEKAGILVDEGPFETMFKKLEMGRVDCTATADVGGILTLAALFPGREQEFAMTDFSYTEIRTGLYAKASPESTAMLAAVKKAFEGMKKDGTLHRYLTEFFGPVNAGMVKVF